MLPFIEPEDDIYINLCVLLLLINTLAKTSRGGFTPIPRTLS